ncbi:MAG: hypothetical protein WC292_02695 [Clostridia bacterium]
MIGNNNLMTFLPLLMSGMGNNSQQSNIAEMLMKMQGGGMPSGQGGMPGGMYGQGGMPGGMYGQGGMPNGMGGQSGTQGGVDNNNMMTMMNLMNMMNSNKKAHPAAKPSNTPPYFDTIGNILPQNMIEILSTMLHNNTKQGH